MLIVTLGKQLTFFTFLTACTLCVVVGDPKSSHVSLNAQARDYNKLPVPQFEQPGNPSPVSSAGYESLRDFSGDAGGDTFIRRRLFNTSIALTVPLFSFTLPSRGSSQGSTVDLANQVRIIIVYD